MILVSSYSIVVLNWGNFAPFPSPLPHPPLHAAKDIWKCLKTVLVVTLEG